MSIKKQTARIIMTVAGIAGLCGSVLAMPPGRNCSCAGTSCVPIGAPAPKLTCASTQICCCDSVPGNPPTYVCSCQLATECEGTTGHEA